MNPSRYYNGKPCKRAGHTLRYVSTKSCVYCQLASAKARRERNKVTDNTGYIYLAAPYSTGLIATSPTLRRVDMRRRRHRIDCAAAQLISEGHVVYSPVSHGCAIEPHIRTTMTHADWLKQCLPLLLPARELRVLMLPGWRESRGVALEIEWATAAGIPVSYMDCAA